MGELLKSKEARLARWKEHFDEVLVNWEIPELSPQEYEEDGWELDISSSHPPHKKYELH